MISRQQNSVSKGILAIGIMASKVMIEITELLELCDGKRLPQCLRKFRAYMKCLQFLIKKLKKVLDSYS